MSEPSDSSLTTARQIVDSLDLDWLGGGYPPAAVLHDRIARMIDFQISAADAREREVRVAMEGATLGVGTGPGAPGEDAPVQAPPSA